jgi:phosphoglycolate phosphatase
MKTIIFDFDGTLGDSFEVGIEIAHNLTGIPPLGKKEMARLRRLPLLKVVRELGIPLRRLPRLVLQARQQLHARMHEIHPFDGMPASLAALHEQGYRLLIMSSNSEQNIRVFLRTNHIEQYFSSVYGNVGLFDKAAALRKVIRRNKIARGACFYVGDEVRDVAAAKKVGVSAVAVGWGYQDPKALAECQPFALARNPAELQAIFN